MGEKSSQKIFWLIILLSAGMICVNGVTTEVHLGDESHHYRFAQNIYQEGRRVPYDPLYESGNPPGFFNNDPPLWHFGLALLWKVSGETSQTLAQIYHVLFFILLLWVTSALFKETVGEKGKWLPVLIMATVPMVVSFSTLFYMDIPMTALATLSFYLILKKQYIGAGISAGLMYFTKLNGGFFVPGLFLLILLKSQKRIINFLKNLAFFIIPILLIHIPDFYWRKMNISSKMNIVSVDSVVDRLSLVIKGTRWREFLNSYLTDPSDIVKYFGVAFLFIFFNHILRFRRWERKDSILWIPVASYFILFIIFFGVHTDIRYLLPILPFLVVLSTPFILTLGKKWKIILIGICILQFVSTTYYVHQRRQISHEVKEGFELIKRNVPNDALILYPEENLLIYGQRRMIWSAFQMGRLYLLFWGTDQSEMKDLLKTNHIDHILIKKSRIYDDRIERHLGGYPKSFVERLPHLDGWTRVFENSEMALWKRNLSF